MPLYSSKNSIFTPYSKTPYAKLTRKQPQYTKKGKNLQNEDDGVSLLYNE